MTQNIQITDSTLLTRNQSLFATASDDDLVMLDEQAGLYFGLNSIARKIWELLEQPIQYQQLIQSLTAQYDVDSEQCKKDVEPFLAKMLENKLIDIT